MRLELLGPNAQIGIVQNVEAMGIFESAGGLKLVPMQAIQQNTPIHQPSVVQSSGYQPPAKCAHFQPLQHITHEHVIKPMRVLLQDKLVNSRVNIVTRQTISASASANGSFAAHRAMS